MGILDFPGNYYYKNVEGKMVKVYRDRIVSSPQTPGTIYDRNKSGSVMRNVNKNKIILKKRE